MKTQAAARAEKRQKKSDERMNDTGNSRGFSTEQRISIESLNINKRRLEHQQNETRLVGLSIQQSAIESQIEGAERRANLRCPEYDENNIHWKRVDDLLEQQSEVIKLIKEYNLQITKESSKLHNTEVSEFLNQASPIKKPKEKPKEAIDLVSDTKPAALEVNESEEEQDDTDDETRHSRLNGTGGFTKQIGRVTRSKKGSGGKVSE